MTNNPTEVNSLLLQSLCNKIKFIQINLIVKCNHPIISCLHSLSIELFTVGIGAKMIRHFPAQQFPKIENLFFLILCSGILFHDLLTFIINLLSWLEMNKVSLWKIDSIVKHHIIIKLMLLIMLFIFILFNFFLAKF